MIGKSHHYSTLNFKLLSHAHLLIARFSSLEIILNILSRNRLIILQIASKLPFLLNTQLLHYFIGIILFKNNHYYET